MAGQVTAVLLTWVASMLDDPDQEGAAQALVAQLDGALLLRHRTGPSAGERAAVVLGWR